MNNFWTVVLFLVTVITIHRLPLSDYMPRSDAEVRPCNANGDEGAQHYYANRFAFCLGSGIRDKKWRRTLLGGSTTTGPPTQEEFCSSFIGCCGSIDSQGTIIGQACGDKWTPLTREEIYLKGLMKDGGFGE